MKFFNKDKKALTLIEVMVFFVISSILLMITLPSMTQEKSNRICTPGGEVTFDGTKSIIGDSSGVVKTKCDNDGHCEYWWKSPVNEIYVISVGGGGGGSRAIKNRPRGECEAWPDYYSYDSVSDQYTCLPDPDPRASGAEPYLYPLCGYDFSDLDNIKYVKPYDTTTTHLPFGLDPSDRSNDAVLESGLNSVIPSYKEYATLKKDIISKMLKYFRSKAKVSSPTCDPITGTPRPVYKGMFCNLDKDGKEKWYEEYPAKSGKRVYDWSYCNAFQPKDPTTSTPNEAIVNGAGGMGGYYTFGANFDSNFVRDRKNCPSGQEKLCAYQQYMENQAEPIFLKKGSIYHIVVGRGGMGGGGTGVLQEPVGHKERTEAGKNYLYDGLSGEDGTASCIISDKINEAPVTCRAALSKDGFEDAKCNSDESCRPYIFAVAAGGRGAEGTIRDNDDNIKSSGGGYISVKSYKGYQFTQKPTSVYVNYSAPFVGIVELGVTGNLDEYYRTRSKLWGKGFTSGGVTNPDAAMYQTLGKKPQIRNEEDFKTLLSNFQYYAPQTTGMPGSVVAPGKGGPSLFGVDRPGSGGSGNYIIKKDGVLVDADRKNARGKDGVVQIRWFTTCE